MANTFTLISSTVLADNSTSTLSFTSIPSTYTDLCIQMTTRSYRQVQYDPLNITINNLGTNYSYTVLSNTFGTRGNADSRVYLGDVINADFNYSNTYPGMELYFPDYAGTTRGKTFTTFGSAITFATNNYTLQIASARNSTTAAISSIQLYSAGSWKANSSFYLYGIKNS